MKYQVTLFSTTGKYKPISAIVETAKATTKEDVKAIQKKGVEKICISRLWKSADLTRYGYTKIKVRVYDLDKINAENKARYEAIKEEKYATGEWKRPKKEAERG